MPRRQDFFNIGLEDLVASIGSPHETRMVSMIRASLLIAAAGARKELGGTKELVAGAHPYLKSQFSKTGKLTGEDFAAAEKIPYKKALPKLRASRLGAHNTDVTSEDCATAMSAECEPFVGSDDDVVGNAPSTPGACAACGFFDFASGETAGFMDCVTCADDGYEILVLFDDCTGMCVDASSMEYYARFGFAGLDDSACTLYTACYDEGSAALSASLGGTNAMYASDGGSYSYSYSYGGGGDDAVWGCASDGSGTVTISMDCDCDCNCGQTFNAEDFVELAAYVDGACASDVGFSCDGTVLTTTFCENGYSFEAETDCAAKGYVIPDALMAQCGVPETYGDDDDLVWIEDPGEYGGGGDDTTSMDMSVTCEGQTEFCDCTGDCTDEEGSAWCQCEEAQACCAKMSAVDDGMMFTTTDSGDDMFSSGGSTDDMLRSGEPLDGGADDAVFTTGDSGAKLDETGMADEGAGEPLEGDADDCVDSALWHKFGDTSKDCAWVGRFTRRCMVKGQEEGVRGKTLAMHSCPCACGDSGDSTSWHKNGDSNKDCAWVAVHDTRCLVKGWDKSLALDACPTACQHYNREQ